MVYKIFADGSGEADGSDKRRRRTRRGLRDSSTALRIPTGSTLASLLLALIRLLLFIYDTLSLPIYFLLQRPDLRAAASQQRYSEQVDASTWIRGEGCGGWGAAAGARGRTDVKSRFMGSTLSEVFASAVRDFHERPSLGYRAVVTCPVFAQNELGQQVLQERSFRSDFTWYTFGQVGRRVQDIASGLYQHSALPGSRILFWASSSPEWFCVAQAAFQLNLQLVLVPELNQTRTLRLALAETGAELVLTSCDRLEQLCRMLDSLATEQPAPTIRRLVLIDWQFAIDFAERTFAHLAESVARGQVAEVLSMGQLEEAGIELPLELGCSRALGDENFGTGAGGRAPDCKPPPSKTTIEPLDGASGRANDQPRRVQQVAGPLEASEASRSPTALLRWRHRTNNRVESQSSNNSASSSTTSGIHFRPIERASPRPQDLALVVYTLGSLGQPRPIMLSHGQLARSNSQLFLEGLLGGHDVHCTTLGLDNIVEFMCQMCIFGRGGSIGFSSNLNTLFYDGSQLFKRDKSDLSALQPTFLLLRPYVLERLRTSVSNYLQLHQNPLVTFAMKSVLYDYKKHWLQRHYSTPLVDKLFCSKLRQRLFGSRLGFVLCNGPAECSETRDFFAFMLGLPVVELLGPSEACASLISVGDGWQYRRWLAANRWLAGTRRNSWGWLFQLNNHHHQGDDDEQDEDHLEEDLSGLQLMPPKVNKNNTFRPDSSRNLLISSSILSPTSGVRIRLEDWEDFRLTDEPFPRGRLVIGGSEIVCEGFLNRPDLNASSFYSDSNRIRWFRTDQVARIFPNGCFEIISAISDMIKMLDGQFVSLSQIEHVLRNSRFVDNVCAVCAADRRLVVALLVPNLRRLALKSPGEANLKMAIGPEPEPEELADVEFRREVCNDRLLSEFVGGHLRQLVASEGLDQFPIRFLLVPEIWTPESELVTANFEPRRSSIEKFYATDIQSILRINSRSASQRLSSRCLRRLRPAKSLANNSQLRTANRDRLSI